MYMTVILIFISVPRDQRYPDQQKEGNKPGFYIGGLLTLATIGVTLLAVYDELIGIQSRSREAWVSWSLFGSLEFRSQM